MVWLTKIIIDSLGRLAGTGVPMWPGTQVPIIYAKAGDILVHLGGAAAFMAVGLSGNVRKSRIALLGLGVALTGLSRGGLLAFSLAFGFAFVTRPRSRNAWALVTLFVMAAVFLAVTDLRLRYPGNDREVSFAQFTERFASTAGRAGGQDLENTKSWRLAWWGTIIGYTIVGDYRWAGKGYGINLATDDGFQVTDDDSLRSPHNATMTILARSGVIGLLAWLSLLGTWSITLLRAMLRARQRQDRQWSALFAFLLAYFLALFVNASFDVYLEGPVGGIWFWSVLGVGIGATLIYRQQVDELPSATVGAT
jgi:O-antigen ligase